MGDIAKRCTEVCQAAAVSNGGGTCTGCGPAVRLDSYDCSVKWLNGSSMLCGAMFETHPLPAKSAAPSTTGPPSGSGNPNSQVFSPQSLGGGVNAGTYTQNGGSACNGAGSACQAVGGGWGGGGGGSSGGSDAVVDYSGGPSSGNKSPGAPRTPGQTQPPACAGATCGTPGGSSLSPRPSLAPAPAAQTPAPGAAALGQSPPSSNGTTTGSVRRMLRDSAPPYPDLFGNPPMQAPAPGPGLVQPFQAAPWCSVKHRDLGNFSITILTSCCNSFIFNCVGPSACLGHDCCPIKL